jgi:hypothetical protein
LEDQVRIEERNPGFAIVLIQSANSHDMDKRNSYKEAEGYALYLAKSLKLNVYYQGKRVN